MPSQDYTTLPLKPSCPFLIGQNRSNSMPIGYESLFIFNAAWPSFLKLIFNSFQIFRNFLTGENAEKSPEAQAAFFFALLHRYPLYKVYMGTLLLYGQAS